MATDAAASSTSTSTPMQLTDAQLQAFHEDGYLIIPDALDAATVAALRAETDRLLGEELEAALAAGDHPMTTFSTGEKSAHVGDKYFLESGDRIRFFFEEDAISPSTHTLRKPAALAINKIGHYLHELSPPFRAVSLSPTNAALARQLGFRDPRVLQSMVICKQPEIGGRVPPHQDSTFLYTDPPSAVGFWYALEDAGAGNGGLSFAPGSHRREPIRKRFVRMPGGGTGFVENESARFPEGLKGVKEQTPEEAEAEVYRLAEVKAGALVLIHGNVLHKSERNTSGRSRFIYTFHCIEGEVGYDGRNWLQPPAQGFSRLFGEGRGG